MQNRNTSRIIAFLSLVLIVASIFIPARGVLQASNNVVEVQDFYLDGDPGYYKLKVKFLQDFTIAFTDPGEPDGWYRYGDSGYARAFVIKTSSKNTYNRALIPDLLENLNWTTPNISYNYHTGDIVDFYIVEREIFFYPFQNSIDGLWNTTNIEWEKDVDWVRIECTNQYGQTISDSQYYYFSGLKLTGPSVNITYPEHFKTNLITEAFTIEGTYTNPDNQAWILVARILDVHNNEVGRMTQWIWETTSGSFDPRYMTYRESIAPGYYTLQIGFYAPDVYINYSKAPDWIVDNLDLEVYRTILPSLPSGETPPPQYTPYDPAIYYTDHSQYPTSTPLYSAISGAIAPLADTIGSNLSYFSNQFSVAKAQEAGGDIGQSILLARAYINNINDFFGVIPVVQIMLFYLLCLVCVNIFRLIKNLINIVKL